MATQALTGSEFRVDLSQFEDAIHAVSNQASTIDTRCSDITAVMQVTPQEWVTPAGAAFDDLAQACTRQMGALSALLAEMVNRMRSAYQTYLNAEQANFGNFQ